MNNSLIAELTNRLISALDSNYDVVDMDTVLFVISKLEGAQITKEQLETTRLAMYINTLRRRTKSDHIARRSKNLLKKWRETFIPSLPTTQTQEQVLQRQQNQSHQKQQFQQSKQSLQSNRIKSKSNFLSSHRNHKSPPTIILDDVESNDYIILNSDVADVGPETEPINKTKLVQNVTKKLENDDIEGLTNGCISVSDRIEISNRKGIAIESENSNSFNNYEVSSKNALSANSDNLSRKPNLLEVYGDSIVDEGLSCGISIDVVDRINVYNGSETANRNSIPVLTEDVNINNIKTVNKEQIIKKENIYENGSTKGINSMLNNKQISFANVFDSVIEKNSNVKTQKQQIHKQALTVQKSKLTIIPKHFSETSDKIFNQTLAESNQQQLLFFDGQIDQTITIDLNDSNDDSNSNFMNTFNSENTSKSEGGTLILNNPMRDIIEHRKNRKHKKDKKRYKEKRLLIHQKQNKETKEKNQPTINLINDLNEDYIFPSNVVEPPICNEISSKTMNTFDTDGEESRSNLVGNSIGLSLPNDGLSLSNSSLSTFPNANGHLMRQSLEIVGKKSSVIKTDLTFAGKFKKNVSSSILTNMIDATSEVISANHQGHIQKNQQQSSHILQASNKTCPGTTAILELKTSTIINPNSSVMIVESRSCSPFDNNVLSTKNNSADNILGTNSNDSCNSTTSNSRISSIQTNMLVEVDNVQESQGKLLSTDLSKLPKKRGRKKGSKGVDALLASQISNTNFMNSQLFESSSKLLSVVSLSAGNKKVKTTKELLADIQNRKISSSTTSSPTSLSQSQSLIRSLPASRPVSRPTSRPNSRAASRPASISSDRSRSPSNSDACTLFTTATSTTDQFGNVLRVEYSSDSNITLPGPYNLNEQLKKNENSHEKEMHFSNNKDIIFMRTMIEDEINILKSQLAPLKYDDIEKNMLELIDSNVACTCITKEIENSSLTSFVDIDKSETSISLNPLQIANEKDSEKKNLEQEKSIQFQSSTKVSSKSVNNLICSKNDATLMLKVGQCNTKPKKSIFDLDYEEDNDPLNSIFGQTPELLPNFHTHKNEKENQIELMSSDSNESTCKELSKFKEKFKSFVNNINVEKESNSKILRENTNEASSDLTIRIANTEENSPLHQQSPRFIIVQDPNCEAKQRYEIQTQKITKFHINALHNCYVSNINGNWSLKKTLNTLNYKRTFEDSTQFENTELNPDQEIVFDNAKLLFPATVNETVADEKNFVNERVVPLYSYLVHDIIPKNLCNIKYDENILKKYEQISKNSDYRKKYFKTHENYSSEGKITLKTEFCKKCNLKIINSFYDNNRLMKNEYNNKNILNKTNTSSETYCNTSDVYDFSDLNKNKIGVIKETHQRSINNEFKSEFKNINTNQNEIILSSDNSILNIRDNTKFQKETTIYEHGTLNSEFFLFKTNDTPSVFNISQPFLNPKNVSTDISSHYKINKDVEIFSNDLHCVPVLNENLNNDLIVIPQKTIVETSQKNEISIKNNISEQFVIAKNKRRRSSSCSNSSLKQNQKQINLKLKNHLSEQQKHKKKKRKKILMNQENKEHSQKHQKILYKVQIDSINIPKGTNNKVTCRLKTNTIPKNFNNQESIYDINDETKRWNQSNNNDDKNNEDSGGISNNVLVERSENELNIVEKINRNDPTDDCSNAGNNNNVDSIMKDIDGARERENDNGGDNNFNDDSDSDSLDSFNSDESNSNAGNGGDDDDDDDDNNNNDDHDDDDDDDDDEDVNETNEEVTDKEIGDEEEQSDNESVVGESDCESVGLKSKFSEHNFSCSIDDSDSENNGDFHEVITRDEVAESANDSAKRIILTIKKTPNKLTSNSSIEGSRSPVTVSLLLNSTSCQIPELVNERMLILQKLENAYEESVLLNRCKNKKTTFSDSIENIELHDGNEHNRNYTVSDNSECNSAEPCTLLTQSKIFFKLNENNSTALYNKNTEPENTCFEKRDTSYILNKNDNNEINININKCRPNSNYKIGNNCDTYMRQDNKSNNSNDELIKNTNINETTSNIKPYKSNNSNEKRNMDKMDDNITYNKNLDYFQDTKENFNQNQTYCSNFNINNINNNMINNSCINYNANIDNFESINPQFDSFNDHEIPLACLTDGNTDNNRSKNNTTNNNSTLNYKDKDKNNSCNSNNKNNDDNKLDNNIKNDNYNYNIALNIQTKLLKESSFTNLNNNDNNMNNQNENNNSKNQELNYGKQIKDTNDFENYSQAINNDNDKINNHNLNHDSNMDYIEGINGKITYKMNFHTLSTNDSNNNNNNNNSNNYNNYNNCHKNKNYIDNNDEYDNNVNVNNNNKNNSINISKKNHSNTINRNILDYNDNNINNDDKNCNINSKINNKHSKYDVKVRVFDKGIKRAHVENSYFKMANINITSNKQLSYCKMARQKRQKLSDLLFFPYEIRTSDNQSIFENDSSSDEDTKLNMQDNTSIDNIFPCGLCNEKYFQKDGMAEKNKLFMIKSDTDDNSDNSFDKSYDINAKKCICVQKDSYNQNINEMQDNIQNSLIEADENSTYCDLAHSSNDLSESNNKLLQSFNKIEYPPTLCNNILPPLISSNSNSMFLPSRHSNEIFVDANIETKNYFNEDLLNIPNDISRFEHIKKKEFEGTRKLDQTMEKYEKEFREWHQVLYVNSYDNEILTVLPYVVID